MITFIILCALLIAVAAVLITMLVVGGVAIGTIGVVVLDVVVGIMPFVLMFMLVRWLFKKRG